MALNDTIERRMVQAVRRVADPADVTPAQREALNYRHGKLAWQGLTLMVEYAPGQVRSGRSKDGRKWFRKMTAAYGRIKGTEGADGEPVDFFMGEHPSSQLVFVLDQLDPDTGKFDEAKVLLGCRNVAEAKAMYLAHYPKGWKGAGEIRGYFLPDFKRKWLARFE